jgi:hypothetical protein
MLSAKSSPRAAARLAKLDDRMPCPSMSSGGAESDRPMSAAWAASSDGRSSSAPLPRWCRPPPRPSLTRVPMGPPVPLGRGTPSANPCSRTPPPTTEFNAAPLPLPLSRNPGGGGADVVPPAPPAERSDRPWSKRAARAAAPVGSAAEAEAELEPVPSASRPLLPGRSRCDMVTPAAAELRLLATSAELRLICRASRSGLEKLSTAHGTQDER